MNSFPQMVTIQENNARLDALRWQSVAHSAERELQATKQELHDFRQEVSDAVKRVQIGFERVDDLYRFIISEPKPDPLAQTLGLFDGTLWEPEDVLRFRAALEARGLKIVEEKNDG